MPQLNLTTQADKQAEIAPYLQKLKTQMDKRIDVWSRLPREKKKKWVKSGKDPIMSMSWTIYKYLDKFFGEVNDD